MQIANNPGCMKIQKFRDIFHRELSRMVNDKHRFKVISRSLVESEYFKVNIDELIDGHMGEVLDDENVYNILTQLCNIGRKDLAAKYAEMLETEKLKNRLAAIMG